MTVSSYNERVLYPQKIEGRTDKLERSYYLSILTLHNPMNHFKMAPIQVHYLSIFCNSPKKFPIAILFYQLKSLLKWLQMAEILMLKAVKIKISHLKIDFTK